MEPDSPVTCSRSRPFWPALVVLALLITLALTTTTRAQEPVPAEMCDPIAAVAAEPLGDDTTVDAAATSAYKIEIAPNLSSVVLENADIKVVYEPFFENHAQFAIRHFYMKKVGNLDQVQENKYLDADAGRGRLVKATMVENTSTRKRVRLEWKDRNGQGRIVHVVTIWPRGALIQINYVNVQAGVNVVDLARPGGTTGGKHIAYGAANWIRGYVTHDYRPTVGSYYNRYKGDRVNDPLKAGSLNYRGQFIVGVYNPRNNIGIGRVMPVRDVEIVKLLLTNDTRRGMEWFPYPFFRSHPPFIGYLYGVTGGPNEILNLGKRLADAHAGTAAAAELCASPLELAPAVEEVLPVEGEDLVVPDGMQIGP